MSHKVCFAIISVFLLSCSESDTSIQGEEPEKNEEAFISRSEGQFDATFTEQTVYFDASERDELLSIDEGGQVYVFKKTSQKANTLKADSILLIHGMALRKVIGVNKAGEDIVIETADATLDELIKDGTIEWTTYFDFKAQNPIQLQVGDKIYAANPSEGNASLPNNTIEFEATIGAYKYTLTVKSEEDSAYIKLEATKNISSGIKRTFMAEGTISGFSSSNKLEYSDSKLVHFSNENKNLKGDLTLRAAIADPGADDIDEELPFVILQAPFMVGPIPTLVKIKLQFVVRAYIPLLGSAHSAIRFKYNSETGFKYDGVNVAVGGFAGDYSIEDNESTIAATSPIALGYGIGFPRLEIGIFDNMVAPWIQTALWINNDYTPYPPCNRTRASFYGAFGYDFNFLGVKQSYQLSKNIWDEEKVLLKVGNCPE